MRLKIQETMIVIDQNNGFVICLTEFKEILREFNYKKAVKKKKIVVEKIYD
ncbi:MAG: hypothetical protein LBB45_04155 [Methanobrevibacter sp.]|jgi:hypothetical protein|nr:hypothetical protein [Candidatus Methanovirga basalitermitum]